MLAHEGPTYTSAFVTTSNCGALHVKAQRAGATARFIRADKHIKVLRSDTAGRRSAFKVELSPHIICSKRERLIAARMFENIGLEASPAAWMLAPRDVLL